MSSFPSFSLDGPNSVLRPSIGALDRLVDEARFEIDSSGLRTQMVDAANVGMIRLEVPAANFERFEAEEWTFGVNIDALSDALREIGKRDNVALDADAGSGQLRVVGPGGEQIDTLELIDPEDIRDEPDIPALDWKTEFELPGDQFSRLIRGSKRVSDHLVMGVAPDGRVGHRDEMIPRTTAEGDVDELIGYPDHEFVGIGKPGEATASTYSLDYLDSFRLGIDKPASTDVRFRFAASEFPMQMEFSIGDAPGAEVLYFLAPRIQSDSPAESLTRYPAHSAALDTVDWVADADGGRATELFKTINTYVDEAKVLVNDLGMETRAVDPANVAMEAIEVEPAYWDSYTEQAGFPQRPIGLNAGRISDYLRTWTKSADFEMAGDSSTRYVSLKHDIFTVRVATIDPDSIREEPTLPDITVSSRARVDVESYREAVDDVLEVGNHIVHVVTGGDVFVAGPGDEETRVRTVAAIEVDGRAFTFLSGDFATDMLDTWPDEGTVEVRAGVEFPIVYDTRRGPGESLRAIYLIAPRVITGDTNENVPRRVKEALGNRDVALPWLRNLAEGDFDAGDREFDVLSGFEEKSISERMRERRLSTFPIETKVVLGLGEGRAVGGEDMDATIRVAEAEDIAVPETTIDDVLEVVANTVEFDVLDRGEVVADVTFESEREFSIDFRNIQPEFEYRTATSDGIRMSRISREDNNYAYASEGSETPSRNQVIVRATEEPDGDAFGVFVGMKEPQESADSGDAGVLVDGGHPTIGNAYAALLDYVQERSIGELIQTAGGETTLSDREVRDRLETIADEFVDYRLHGKPGAQAADSDFYAVIKGSLNFLPDAEWRADIAALAPEEPGGPYRVRYVLSLEATGPGNAREGRELASKTVGHAAAREDIIPLFRESFDQLESFGDIYVRTENRPAPPRSPGAGPGVKVGEIGNEPETVPPWTEFYLPAPREEIIEAMEASGFDLPLELTDVQQVGPSRAEPLLDQGIRDMLDYVALTGTKLSTGIGGILLDLPDPAQENLTDAAKRIWTEIIWPRRDAPEGFEPPETDISDDIREEPERELPETVAGWQFDRDTGGLVVYRAEGVTLPPKRIPRNSEVGLHVVEADEEWRLSYMWEEATGGKSASIGTEETRDSALDRAFEIMRENPVEAESEEPEGCELTAEGRELANAIAGEIPDNLTRVDRDTFWSDRPFELIGRGQDRVAVEPTRSGLIEGDCILKFTRELPPEQNRSEVANWEAAPPAVRDVLAPIHDDGADGRWLLMRRGDESAASNRDLVRVEDVLEENDWRCRGLTTENIGLVDGEPAAIDYGMRCFAGDEPVRVEEEPEEPEEEADTRADLEDRTPAPWRLEEVTDSRITWGVDGLTARPSAVVPRDADGQTFIDVRSSRNRWHLRVRWEWDDESDSSRRQDFTVGDARQKAIDAAIEMMQEFQPEPEEPEEPPFVGAVEATPVVRLFGDRREVNIEDIDVDLPESLREEVREAVQEEIDIERAPLGEPLGTVRLRVDGVEETRLERAQELMQAPEESEAQDRANEALDILRE